MRILLTLVGKDFANLRRNRAALVFTFIVPMVVIYIVGMVFGLGRSDNGPSGIGFAVVNESDSPVAQRLVRALRADKTLRVITKFNNPDKTSRALTEADLRPMIHDRQFSYALVIPPDLVSDSRLGLHLRVLSDPRNDIENQTISGLLQRTVFANLLPLLGPSFQARALKVLGAAETESFDRMLARDVGAITAGNPGGAPPLGRVDQPPAPSGGSARSAGTDLLSRLVDIDQEQVVGKDVKSPTATRVVGGYAVMFLLFALSSSAAAFFDEQNAGLFQRLLSSPVSRAQLLCSRLLYGILFGLAQLVALFFAGHVLYGVDVFGHLGNLLLICASVAAACTSFGMLLTAITRSSAAASSLSTLLVISMSACGGAWFPVSFMPEFMQHIARFTLVYWAIEGFNAVLWAGDTFQQLLPILGILLGTTAVVMIFAVWRFNRRRLFD